MAVKREIEIEATPEEVWEALATEAGREAWLEPVQEAGRQILVEAEDAPRRLVWWWWEGAEPATRVELRVVAAPAGARVIVTESAPAVLPLTALAARFALVAA